MSVPEFVEQGLKEVPEDINSPYDFYCLFVDDDFINRIVHCSKHYAGRKGNVDVQQVLTKDDIRIAHAIMYLTGYLNPANRNMFWENWEDTSNSLVKRAMPQRVFININSNTVFVDTAETPTNGDRQILSSTI